MLPLGTSVGLDELPLAVRLPAAVSASPTVKAIAPVELSSLMVTLLMQEIVGGVLPEGLTISTKVSLAVSAPSLTVTVIVAVPVCPAAGVTVTVRLAPLPPKTMLPLCTNVGLDELPLTVRLPAAVSTSPTVKLIAPVWVSSLIVWLARFEIVGASFTALTVSPKLVFVLDCPSLTVSVIVAEPFWLVAGVTVTVRLAPLPPKTMLPLGASVGVDELPLTVKLPAAVSASPTVKLIAPVGASSLMVWFAMFEIVGGSFWVAPVLLPIGASSTRMRSRMTFPELSGPRVI